jgi:hypothetical protein
MKYAPEYFASVPELDTGYHGFVIYTANGLFADRSPSFCVMMVL